MRPFLRLSLTAFAACALAATGALAQVANDPPAEMRGQQWAADHEAMLDAKLAGLKAGLRLNPDQEKLWEPFEAAVREAADMRMKHMEEMMAHWREMRGDEGAMRRGDEKDSEGGERMSPVDRLDRMATRLSDAGAALKKIADAAKPLYASLDEQQQRIFNFLSREMMRMGHHPAMEMGMEGRHRWRGEEERGPGGRHPWRDEDDEGGSGEE